MDDSAAIVVVSSAKVDEKTSSDEAGNSISGFENSSGAGAIEDRGVIRNPCANDKSSSVKRNRLLFDELSCDEGCFSLKGNVSS